MRLDVQGLRAIAVLAVMVYHLDELLLPSGFVGVDVFFVISGFIITSLIIQRREGFDWAGFYWSRIKRIAPAYFLMLVVVALFSSVLFLPADYNTFWESLKAASSFSSNTYFADFGSYFAPSVHELPLLHTWSLAVEMQFYLLWPVLVCFVPLRFLKPTLFLLTLGLLIWSEHRLAESDGHALYFSLLARIPEFMIGALVALSTSQYFIYVKYRSWLGVVGALLLVISFVFIDVQDFPGARVLLPCLGTALIIAANHGPVSTLLATKSLVWLGGISYSLYLWHWPILAFIRYYTGRYDLEPIWTAVFIISSLVCAWVSYRLVELPVRNAHGVRTAPIRLLGFLTCAVVVTFYSRHLNLTVVDKLPVEMTRYAPAEEICHGKVVAECVRGASGLKPSVLVIGDSHAAQLNYFFDEVGAKNNMAFRVITASSCVPIIGFDIERLPRWAQDSCRSQIAKTSALIPETDMIIVAGMWQYQVQSDEFVQAFFSFLDMAGAQNKKVIVLAQIPMFDSNLLRIQRFSELGLPVRINQNDEWKAANSKIKSIVQRTPSAKFLDFSESSFFISAPFEHDVLVYLDNHHLNEIGARRYGRYAADFLKLSAIEN
ncbi:acetyltransferase [Stutzerimonas stutzeri]|uniref:Acetyltransferase n=1 Tax=Stutzerimonas stutzeri TaxID=316 RepID=A0A172WXN0_STUST|nr:acetyltransferase [Stutzerimonas stutzeri]